MIAKHILQIFGEFAFRMISSKVDLLVKRCGFNKSDREDLYEDFALNLFARSAKFDPTEGTWEAFVLVVCENFFADVLAHRFAEKRSRCREEASLNDRLAKTDGKSRDWASELDERRHQQRTGQRFRAQREAWEMADDVRAVMEHFTDLQRAICRLLMRLNVSETARELGISRSAVNKEIAIIRERFEQAGLRNYL